MNKYSSKAVKTAATVGMSLAMVLGNVAPVLAATNFTTTEYCKSEDVNTVAKAMDKVSDLTTVNAETEYDNDTTLFKYAKDNAKAFAGVAGCYTIDSDIRNYAKTLTEMINEIEKLTEDTSWSEIDEELTSDPYDGTVSVDGLYKAITSSYDDNGVSRWVKDYTVGALAYRDFLNGFDYADNLTSDQSESFEDTKDELNDQLDALGYSSDEVLDDYLTDLEDLYDEFIKVEGANGITKSKVDAVVKGIKNGTYATKNYAGDTTKGYKSLTKGNYGLFEENDAVVELMDQFTAGYDAVEAVKDALSSKNEYTVAVTKDKAKYDGKTNETLTKWMADKDFSVIKNTMTEDTFAIVKDYKENVIDIVLSLDSKLVGSTYIEKSEKSDYASNKQVKDLINNLATKDHAANDSLSDLGIFAISDKKEGTRYYDDLATHMAGLSEALTAVTTDIEAITPANIKSTDKATLEAAEDAIYELTSDKGDYSGNLTSAQEKTVRQAETKITNLREAFDNLGTTTVAGWYDMGNGNWGYNNEDGTPAAYKWVASGSNWYFVKDGKMVRSSWLATDGGRWYYLDSEGKMVTNQSVDGCWINSYGVYMSPSYNG